MATTAGLTVLSLVALICAGACTESTGVERPCGATEAVDGDCVRAHLSARSGCTPVSCAAGLDPYYPPDLLLYTNYFNITLVKPGSTYKGLSKSVLTDYIVDSTNNVTIISLLHPFINLTGPIDIAFQKVDEASLSVSSVYNDQYTNLKTWTVIPGTSQLDLSKRQTHYFQTTSPSITFGDDNLQSYIDSDTLVASVVETLQANIYIVAHDSLFGMSKVFAEAVIGHNFCSLNENEPYFQNYAL